MYQKSVQKYHLGSILSCIRICKNNGKALFLGIENPNRSILRDAVNRSPCSISTFFTSTIHFGRKTTEFWTSGALNEGRAFRVGGDELTW